MQAAPVSSSRALDVAKKIFSAQSAKRGVADVRIVWDGEFPDDPATKAPVAPAFYVVAKDGGGWVIISGDDNVRPVLGISADGAFKTEGMPDNVRWWMERMKAYVRSTKAQAPDVAEQWSVFVDTKANASIPSEYVTNVVDRKTPDWNQESPFNDLCPKIGNTPCITGCVATALAELLTFESGQGYQNFPDHATGTVGGYDLYLYDFQDSPYITPESYTLGTVYRWNDLRGLTNVDIAIGASADLKTNLARLCADLGAIVKAEYYLDNTGADSYGIIGHMIAHFGLNKAAAMKHDYDFTPREWVTSLMAELDERPILFSGTTERGYGHAFLLDGYGSDGITDDVFFRVNFGWGGYNNGFYCLYNMDDGSNGNWAYSFSAFFDFYPKSNSAAPAFLEAYYYDVNYPGVRSVLQGNGYFFYVCIYNRGNEVYNGQLKFKVLHKDGSESEINNSAINYTDLSPNYYGAFSFGSFPINTISFGDRVVCYYKDGSDWRRLDCAPGNAVSEWPLFSPATFIYTEDSYSVGDYFAFRLMNNHYIYKAATWKITDPDGVVTTLPQSEREFQFTKSGKYKVDATVRESASTDPVIETLVTYITVAN
jgi:hypothetical protein